MGEANGTGCAIVTGAAGGIGSATTRALKEKGFWVVGVDVRPRPEGADRLSVDAWATGDVSDGDTLEAAFAAADELGGATVLVTSTFRDHRAPLLDLSSSDLTSVIDDQIGAAWQWSRRFAESWAALQRTAGASPLTAGGGAIVHVSSVHAYLAAARSGPYSAAKAALLALTRTTAVEWGPIGIRCNAVAPGFVPVPRNATRWTDDGQRRAIEAELPLRRVVSPDDVGRCVAFLSGSDARGITGVCIPVDAGMLATMPNWA